MLRRILVAATALCIACPGGARAPHAIDDRALRVRIAQAEARRAAGVPELASLAHSGDPHARALAVRGLGRIGAADAMAEVTRALDDGDVDVVIAAIGAFGVRAALDEDPAGADHAIAARLVSARDAALARATADRARLLRVVTLEAIGRAGDPASQGELARGLADPDPAVAEAAALALGRHGRRKLALGPEARLALVRASGAADARVRHAATYALAREHQPPADPTTNAALAARVTDSDAETRAVAIFGLARRDAGLAAARAPIQAALADRDWRVAVEAVRALAGDHGDPAGRATVASALVHWLSDPSPGADQVVTEALRALIAHPAPDALAQVAPAILSTIADQRRTSHGDPRTRGWIECLTLAALPGAYGKLAACGPELDDAQRLSVLALLVTSGAGTPADRRAAARTLLEHRDSRVRAAGIGTLATLFKDGGDHRTILSTLVAALASPDIVIAGAATDAAPAIYDLVHDDPEKLALDTAVVARAARESDVELGASLFQLIGDRKIAAGAETCRAGLTGHIVRARAAAACLRELGEAVPAPTITAADPPPVDPASVIGRHIIWHVATTRGALAIELRPDVAPWAVATIVALAQRHAYDNLEFHRVVPDFVVQGGDPTQSGWGGPGFTLPAEPATAADGAGFASGGVGLADAGRDSAGSQYFVMHAAAPHLDGRYTWVGLLTAGQNSADALLIGDKVTSTTVEIR